MIVGMWMTEAPHVTTPDTLVTRAAVEMAQLRVGRLPVVERTSRGDELVGIVTEHEATGAS